MSNPGFCLAAGAAAPAVADFIQDWAILAEKSGYCRRRLAKNLRVSTRTLDRYFEKHLSLSAQQWLSESRLAVAYNQVRSGKPLKEISFDLGFKQPANFTRLFKARFGVVPSFLRASCGGRADTEQAPRVHQAPDRTEISMRIRLRSRSSGTPIARVLEAAGRHHGT